MARHGASGSNPTVVIAIVVGIVVLVLMVAGYYTWRRRRRAANQTGSRQRPLTRPDYSQVNETNMAYDSATYQNNTYSDTAPMMAPAAAYYPERSGGSGNAGFVQADNAMMWSSVNNAAGDPIY